MSAPVLVCGTLAIDALGHCDQRFAWAGRAPNMSVQLQGFAISHGGCAMNIAYGIRQLGGLPVPHVRAGRDVRDGYLQHLQRCGIPTDAIRIDEQAAFSARCIVLTDRHGHQITAFFAGAAANPPDHPLGRGRAALRPAATARRHRARHAILAPDAAATMLATAADLQRIGVACVLDPGQGVGSFTRDEARAMLDGGQRLIVNAHEWAQLCRQAGWRERRARAALDWLIVTHGADGAQLWLAGQPQAVAAASTRAAVDPTGAGDALRAGLMTAWVEGAEVAAALRCGVVAAAFCVEVVGTQSYRMSRRELVRRYRREFVDPCPLAGPPASGRRSAPAR